jgi:hypothetical protein
VVLPAKGKRQVQFDAPAAPTRSGRLFDTVVFMAHEME